MYEKQTQSKKNRQFARTLRDYFRIDDLIEELNKKHLKKLYAGKPTKKYEKLSQELEKVENMAISQIGRTINSLK